mgnify:CR=1 FL=1
MSYVKIGVAGPVGSGKTALIEALTRRMSQDYSIGVITNDIYTKEDAEFLAKNSVMPRERIIGVETGEGVPVVRHPQKPVPVDRELAGVGDAFQLTGNAV